LALVAEGRERFTAVNLFELVARLQEIKDSYDDKFKELTRQFPVIAKLCSIPGISYVRAATITAIICSPALFAGKHKLWAYSGLVRHLNESDGRIYGSRKAHGRKELKAVFLGAATAILCGSSGLRCHYDQLRSKGTSHNDAKKAVARRVAAISLMVMKTGKTYDDKYQEKRRRLTIERRANIH
jgi:transposase